MPQINIWDIEPFWPDRPHFDYEALKSSLRSLGMLNPVTVLPSDCGTFSIVNGHWRVLAARAIGMYQIPAYVVGDDDDDDEPGFYTREGAYVGGSGDTD